MNKSAIEPTQRIVKFGTVSAVFNEVKAFSPIEWMPIKSAPHDGSFVLVRHDNSAFGFPFAAKYDYEKRTWRDVSGPISSPSHWMPFIAPPESA